jgi:hypothetical protein
MSNEPLQIEYFIKEFKKGFDEQAIVDCFTKGNCYHFAVILNEAFSGHIYYYQVDGHFIFYDIDSQEFYDITGKLNKRDYIDSVHFDELFFIDNLLYQRLIHDCVYKKSKEGETLCND